MPRLKSQLPKYCKCGKYAAVYLNGDRVFLGLYGSPESKKEYARIVAEIQSDPTFLLPKREKGVTLDEVAAAYLGYAKKRFDKSHYENYRVALQFALDIYGHLPVDEFPPLKLKTIREEVIRSRRFCRKVVNRNIGRILTAISWAVENELAEPRTVHALREVKRLSKGTPGTFDHKKRRAVPDDVIRRTLPFLPPTLASMVKLQRLTGLRPSEVFRMTVGSIDRTQDSEFWFFNPEHHKTEQFTDEDKIIPLGKLEQELIAPYLKGKKPSEAMFSPRQAMLERNADKKANGKTKPTPSRIARDTARATKPRLYKEFYDKDSYNKAIAYAIQKGNRRLSEGEQPIPKWTPYQLRHAAGTETSRTQGREKAQALLTHKSIETTGIYDHSQEDILKELARNRKNPFESVERERK